MWNGVCCSLSFRFSLTFFLSFQFFVHSSSLVSLELHLFLLHIWTNISGCKSFFYAKRIHSKSYQPNARQDYHKWKTSKQSHYALRWNVLQKLNDKMHVTKTEWNRWKTGTNGNCIESFVRFEFEFWINKKMLIVLCFWGSLSLGYGIRIYVYAHLYLEYLNAFNKLNLGFNTIKADFYPIYSVDEIFLTRSLSLSFSLSISFVWYFPFSSIFGLSLPWKIWNSIWVSSKHTKISSKQSQCMALHSKRIQKNTFDVVFPIMDVFVFVCNIILLSIWKQNEGGKFIQYLFIWMNSTLTMFSRCQAELIDGKIFSVCCPY